MNQDLAEAIKLADKGAEISGEQVKQNTCIVGQPQGFPSGLKIYSTNDNNSIW